MFCCPNCFTDKFLKKHINVNRFAIGKCSFCNSNDVSLVKTSSLLNFFEPLLDMYLEDKKGKLIDQLIQSDWDVFSLEDLLIRQKLLTNITNNDKLFTVRYIPAQSKEKKNILQWEIFREELKHKNRFFPNDAPKIETLEPFGKYLGKKIEKGAEFFYRARINLETESIDISRMGKPPEKKTSNGRANPIGIPYLYVASSIDTAIAEVRGYKGEFTTIAEFEMNNELELADLRNPKSTISPFELDEDELELIYKNLPFLELLGKELTKPIIPREANLEYLPSQYLSELLKHIGFHGIIYKSSVSQGNNYVIFDDYRLKITETFQYEITDVLTKSRKIL
jgi:hypothetical protein